MGVSKTVPPERQAPARALPHPALHLVSGSSMGFLQCYNIPRPLAQLVKQLVPFRASTKTVGV